MGTFDIASVIRENQAGHEALVSLVGRLTDEDLARPLGSGRNIAAALLHLAFWDARAVVLIEKWRREGVGPSPVDVDVTNDSVLAVCGAIPPRAAAGLAVEKSAEINRLLESLPPKMIGQIREKGPAVHLARHEHKRIHIEEIEKALGGKNGP
ncbi:MAG: hypothetical protein ACK2UB_13960 [Anaerolineales bacterium]